MISIVNIRKKCWYPLFIWFSNSVLIFIFLKRTVFSVKIYLHKLLGFLDHSKVHKITISIKGSIWDSFDVCIQFFLGGGDRFFWWQGEQGGAGVYLNREGDERRGKGRHVQKYPTTEMLYKTSATYSLYC